MPPTYYTVNGLLLQAANRLCRHNSRLQQISEGGLRRRPRSWLPKTQCPAFSLSGTSASAMGKHNSLPGVSCMSACLLAKFGQIGRTAWWHQHMVTVCTSQAFKRPRSRLEFNKVLANSQLDNFMLPSSTIPYVSHILHTPAKDLASQIVRYHNHTAYSIFTIPVRCSDSSQCVV